MPSLSFRAMNLFFAPLEMLFATALFAKHYSRRKLWWLWLILGIGAIIGTCFFVSWLKDIILASVDVRVFDLGSFLFSSSITALLDLVLFVLYGLVVSAVFNTEWTNINYIACASFLIQNIARWLYFLYLNIRCPDEQAVLSSFGDPVNIAVYIVTYVAVYALAYFVFLKKFNGADDSFMTKKVSVPLIFIILVNILMGGINAPRENEWASAIYLFLLVSRFILCCIGLVIQFLILNWYKAKFEQSMLYQIMQQQKEQYELAKESIDTVNINAHDLRKQIHYIINSVREPGKTNVVESELKGMIDSINVLDTTYRTGNKALDVTLTEKARLCLKKNIKLSTIADGSGLAFMKDFDIYSLFGNALDNAIEAAERIGDEDGRIISFSLRTGNGFISVHVENTYEEAPKFVGGMPQTIKDDKHIHGFGVKSMVNIAKKYGGTLTMNAENGIFNLDVVLPTK